MEKPSLYDIIEPSNKEKNVQQITPEKRDKDINQHQVHWKYTTIHILKV